MLKTAARRVHINFNQESEALSNLCKLMSSGLVGFIQFPRNCDIRVMTVVYKPNENVYMGYIANDQDSFFNNIRQLARNRLQQQKQWPLSHTMQKEENNTVEDNLVPIYSSKSDNPSQGLQDQLNSEDSMSCTSDDIIILPTPAKPNPPVITIDDDDAENSPLVECNGTNSEDKNSEDAITEATQKISENANTSQLLSFHGVGSDNNLNQLSLSVASTNEDNISTTTSNKEFDSNLSSDLNAISFEKLGEIHEKSKSSLSASNKKSAETKKDESSVSPSIKRKSINCDNSSRRKKQKFCDLKSSEIQNISKRTKPSDYENEISSTCNPLEVVQATINILYEIAPLLHHISSGLNNSSCSTTSSETDQVSENPSIVCNENNSALVTQRSSSPLLNSPLSPLFDIPVDKNCPENDMENGSGISVTEVKKSSILPEHNSESSNHFGTLNAHTKDMSCIRMPDGENRNCIDEVNGNAGNVYDKNIIASDAQRTFSLLKSSMPLLFDIPEDEGHTVNDMKNSSAASVTNLKILSLLGKCTELSNHLSTLKDMSCIRMSDKENKKSQVSENLSVVCNKNIRVSMSQRRSFPLPNNSLPSLLFDVPEDKSCPKNNVTMCSAVSVSKAKDSTSAHESTKSSSHHNALVKILLVEKLSRLEAQKQLVEEDLSKVKYKIKKLRGRGKELKKKKAEIEAREKVVRFSIANVERRDGYVARTSGDKGEFSGENISVTKGKSSNYEKNKLIGTSDISEEQEHDSDELILLRTEYVTKLKRLIGPSDISEEQEHDSDEVILLTPAKTEPSLVVINCTSDEDDESPAFEKYKAEETDIADDDDNIAM